MNRIATLFVLASLSSGCKADMPYLTHAEEIASSQKCPAGGVRLTSGRDWSHDRVLDDDEVMERTEICNGLVRDSDGGVATNDGPAGRRGLSTLINTTTLPFGDPACPQGGVRIETGLDEPVDGGSGDGVLAPGEVQSSRVACNGGALAFVRPIDEPAGPKGQSMISANGGESTSSLGTKGGNAGLITVELVKGTLGGNVKVFSTGTLDAGFEWPVDSFEPGPVPWRVAASIAVSTSESVSAGLAFGQAYFVVSSSKKLMKRIDGQSAAEVSSILVPSGVSLELAAIHVTHDVRVEGSLSPSRSNSKLSIVARRLSVAAGARIVEPLDPDLAVPSLQVRVDELANQGTIDFPGSLEVYTRHFFNRGIVRVSGPTGVSGTVSVNTVTLANSGFIGVSGSSDSSGFRGGRISLATSGGSAVIAGELRAEGGSCESGSCVGGQGGAIDITALNGDIHISAALLASAGHGTVKGGRGGEINIFATSARALPSGSIQLSGSMNVEGGRGAAGGDGGEVHVRLDPVIAQGQEIELFGFSTVMAKGGRGLLTGGLGGAVQFQTTWSGRYDFIEGPSGAVLNSSNVDVSGGDGDSSEGGSIVFQTSLEQAVVTPGELIRNSGALVSNSGRALVIAGRGGLISFSGAGRIENTGSIEATGSSSGEQGVSGGRVAFRSFDQVTNLGSLVVNGRAGTKRGGAGGRVELDGTHIENSGAVIEANGGAGSVTGGNGGAIKLWSTLANTRTSAALQATPGLGATGGEPGSIVVY